MQTDSQNRLAIITVGLLLTLGSNPVQAQITVQQPVVQTFGVDTVVSIPDRGAILLGSVSGARDGRNSYGFGPGGSSIGNDRNHSSAWGTAYIHDFEQLEAELLAGYTPLPKRSIAWNNPQAERAYLTLVNRAATPLPRVDSRAVGRSTLPLRTTCVEVTRRESSRSGGVTPPPAQPVRVTGIQLLRDHPDDAE